MKKLNLKQRILIAKIKDIEVTEAAILRATNIHRSTVNEWKKKCDNPADKQGFDRFVKTACKMLDCSSTELVIDARCKNCRKWAKGCMYNETNDRNYYCDRHQVGVTDYLSTL
jgi:hypothetical protein